MGRVDDVELRLQRRQRRDGRAARAGRSAGELRGEVDWGPRRWSRRPARSSARPRSIAISAGELAGPAGRVGHDEAPYGIAPRARSTTSLSQVHPAHPFQFADRVRPMRVLFIGDVVGGPGRRGLRETMPALRERYAPDLIVVNGENTAGGVGITEKHRQRPLRRRRRRDHHRQPRLPPPRGLRLPRTRAAGDPARQLPVGQPRPRLHGGRGRRHAGRR